MHFPAAQGSTVADTKATILDWVGDGGYLSRLIVETRSGFPAHTVFDYVKPFENGVFAHRYFRNTGVRYTRLINGFYTTESALYYLVDADGSYRTVSCEELQNLLGEDAFLIEPTTPEELERGY